MPTISHANKLIFNRLVDEYHALPSYKKWVYPRAISEVLRAYDEESSSLGFAVAVCNAYLDKNWIFRRGSFSSLKAFSTSPFVLGLVRLHGAGLLTGRSGRDNFDALVQHQNPDQLALALCAIGKLDLLIGDSGPNNRKVVARHQNPGAVALVINLLIRANLVQWFGRNALRRGGVHDYMYSHYINDNFRSGQEIFDLVVIRHSAVLLHKDAVRIWAKIPAHRLTATCFETILALCEERLSPGDARFRLIAYVKQNILGLTSPHTGVRFKSNQYPTADVDIVHAVVNEEVMVYLRGFANHKHRLRDLIGKIKEQDNVITPIWESICAAVKKRMLDEFKSLYGHKVSSRDFIGLIGAGEYVELSESNRIELEAMVSSDQDLMSAASRSRFFSRHGGAGGTEAKEDRPTDHHWLRISKV